MTSRAVHIVHVSSAHPWTDNRIHYRECVTLANAGYETTFVGIEAEVAGPPTSVEIIPLRRRTRLARMTLGSMHAVFRGLRTGASVFHLHDPELVWSVPLLRVLGKKVIFDAHEDLPAQVEDKPYLTPLNARALRTAASLVLSLARRSDQIVAATEQIATRFPAERVTVVHNYPPLRDEESHAPSMGDRPLAVSYLGVIGEHRGAMEMIDAMAEDVVPASWSLELAGPVSPELLGRLKASPGWDSVRFHGRVAPDAARDLLLKSRIGLVLFQDSPAHRDSLPTKMFEYFAAGIPVIASDFPLWSGIIADSECGIVVDQSSPSAIAAAIATYAGDPELLKRHGENARAMAVSRLNWGNEEQSLRDVYAKVLARDASA